MSQFAKQGKPVFIIAEAGVNHNGSPARAKEMIIEAKKAGADAIKFQTFLTEDMLTRQAAKADYQKQRTGGTEFQFAMLKRLELSYEVFQELNDFCKEQGIHFLSTAFEKRSLLFLHEELDVKWIKIPSGEITNLPLLRLAAGLGKPILLSTGMCEAGEIEAALRVLEEGGGGEITLLQCTTEYPAPENELNLRAMETMRRQFGREVGYSDHAAGIVMPIAAAALGATVIEKHFTMDRQLPGPDHGASVVPGEFAVMVKMIRFVEDALGDGVKRRSPSEEKNLPLTRKSIVAKVAIQAGEAFTEENLAVKRPGTGLSPMAWDQVVGQIASRDYEADALIENEEATHGTV
jgi:N,N'-diacetyllegionaminate synthase